MKLLERIPPTANGDACPRTAIVGLGGIGKTQVAIEAAYRVREAHPDCSVFWVPAVSVEMFGNHYRKIGRALKLKNIEDPKADVNTLVRTALERDDIDSWLLIVDNADDTGLLFNGSKLAAYLPYSRRGSILFTSRNSNIAARFDGVHALHLSEMNAQEAAQLLHTGLSESQIDNGRSTTQLLEKLTYLPLALKQASAYLKANPYTSISQYLEYCEASDEEQIKLLGEDFDDQYRYESIQNPVAKTWFISFDNIARDNPLAASYLGFTCHFAERYIPPALLPPGKSERQTHEAISTLMAYAFIKKRHAAENLEIHRLVRLAMQNWLKRQGKEQQQFSETLSASYTEKGSRLLSGLSKTRGMYLQAPGPKEQDLASKDIQVSTAMSDFADTDFNTQFYVKKNGIEEAKATNQQSFQSNKQLLAPEQAVTQTVPESPAHGRKSQGETGEVPWIAQRHWH